MSRQLARLAIALYPLAFRRRYGAELQALLEEEPVGTRSALDLLRGALLAHLRPPAGLAEGLDPGLRVRLALSGVLTCWVAFIAAGLAFYKTTENQPPGGSALGDAHLSVGVLAALACTALLAGALPLVALALRQTWREGRRLAALLAPPLLAALGFAGITGLVVHVAHAHAHPGGATRAAFVAWVLGGFACGAVCVVAARRALLAIAVPRTWLRAALACATLVAFAMAAITFAVLLYGIVLQARDPVLAGAANGPFGAPETEASILLQAGWMGLFSILALLSVRRARRSLA